MSEKIINLGNYNKPMRLKKFIGSANGICYTGMAASFRTEKSDVIIVAANIDDLDEQYFRLLGDIPDRLAIEQVAVFRFHDMRGKRLIKTSKESGDEN